jgi:hypothetical protein
LPVIADDNVFSLAKVNVSQVTGVDILNKFLELWEKIIIDSFATLERIAFHIVVGNSMGLSCSAYREFTAVAGDIGKGGEKLQNMGFTRRKQSSQPVHGESEDWLPTVELGDDLTPLTLIQSSGRPRVMLEDVNSPIRVAVQFDLQRRIGIA